MILKFSTARVFTGFKRLASYSIKVPVTFHQQKLFNDIASLTVNDHTDIKIQDIYFQVVAECVPKLVHKLFSQVPPNNRALRIEMQNNNLNLNGTAELRVQWPVNPNITIVFPKQNCSYELVSTIFQSQLYNIDQLTFYIWNKRGETQEIDLNTYYKILAMMPSIKEAVFDIPASYKNTTLEENAYPYSRLEALTLRATAKLKFQSLLDTYAILFPNLKNLNLFYNFGGVYRFEKGKQHKLVVNLKNYNLERLTIDITPIKRMMNAQSKKHDFFDLKVETLKKTERYKVKLDLSSPLAIDDYDKEAFLCVHIIIDSLQSFAAYVYSLDPVNEEYLNNLHGDGLKHAVIFNKN